MNLYSPIEQSRAEPSRIEQSRAEQSRGPVGPDPALVEATTETRYGPMTFYTIDGYVGRSLEVYGEYSPAEAAFLRRFVKSGWTVVNGGANIGALTVPLAEMVGAEGRVYAFEPQPEAFRLLVKNVVRYPWVYASKLGLWDKSEPSKIPLYAEMEHTNLGGVVVGTGSHVIDMISLDNFLGESRVDLIFMDIEGAEIKALEGATRIIERWRPILYCEDHPEGDGTSMLSSWARKRNYVCYSHKPSLFSKDNWKGVEKNYFLAAKHLLRWGAEMVSFNVLCVPRERIDEYYDIIDGEQPKYLEDCPKRALSMVPPKVTDAASNWAAVCRLGGVGDNLIAASPCRALKAAGYMVEVISQTPHSELFKNNPFVDKISEYAPGALPQDLGQWQDWFRLRSKEYKKFGNLSHSCESRHALFPSQTWFWWPAELRRKICGGNYLETAHDIMGVPYSFGPLFFPTEDEKEQARATLAQLGPGPFVAWCISGTRVDKVYPYTPLVIGRLIKELGVTVIMLGAPTERDLETARLTMDTVKAQNGTIKGLYHAASPSITDQTWPIRRILTFAASCNIYVGFDTGPSWSVAFEPLPKVMLLSHASPENITKHWVNTTSLTADPGRVPCWPCHQLHQNFDTCVSTKVNDGNFSACVSDISAETIVSTVKRLLEER